MKFTNIKRTGSPHQRMAVATLLWVGALTSSCKKAPSSADSPAPAAPSAAEAPASKEAPKVDATAPVTPPVPSVPPQASKGSFQVQLDKVSYQNNDRQKVTVKTPDAGWLYVGSINADGSVYLYYPNPTMPNGRVLKERTITLPPVGVAARDAWDIKVSLPTSTKLGRECVFAVVSKEPIPGIPIEWGVDQRASLVKAGVLSPDARPGKSPVTGWFPESPHHQTAWKEYELHTDAAETPVK